MSDSSLYVWLTVTVLVVSAISSGYVFGSETSVNTIPTETIATYEPTESAIPVVAEDPKTADYFDNAAIVPVEVTSCEGVTVEPTHISEADIELLALLTMGEAEGESEEGKRLVIDTVLNRVDSPYYPDTIREVIYQPNQFSPMWNGRIERCEVREDICQLVREELESRTNYDVIFFTAGQYSKYGNPLFQVGNHYFSSYE